MPIDMSFLGNELKTMLGNTGLRQIDFTKRAGMHVSTVSRIFSGVTINPDDNDLDKIIGLLAKAPPEQAKLVRARMWDAYNGRYKGLVKVILNTGGGGKPPGIISPISIDPEVMDAFQFLCRLVPENPAVGKSMIQLAKMMGHTGKT